MPSILMFRIENHTLTCYTFIYVYFSIPGVIRLRKALDFETQTIFKFNVKADIKGVFTSYATVFVEVQNANDNCPVFSASSYTTTFTGQPEVGSTVYYLRATDADKSSVLYSFIAGMYSCLFNGCRAE